MKVKKFLILTMAIILILGAFSVCIDAQENQSIFYDIIVNGQYYTYNEIAVKANQALEIKIENITLDGNAVDQGKVSYQWEKSCPPPEGMPGLGMEVIAGATESVYSTATYDGTKRYRCTVTVDGIGSRSMEVWLKENTLTVEAQSNKEMVFAEDEGNYYISDLEVGEEVVLTINATSTIQDATITYSWGGGDVYIKPDSELNEGDQITNDTNTLTVTKKEGQQNYYCQLNDGNMIQYVHFSLMSKDTMTDSILANGEHPGTYAGTYIYVTKPGSSVKIEIPSISTEGDIAYTWYYDSNTTMFSQRLDEKGNTITVNKSEMTEENPYAWELYQCYLEDGNDRVRYLIMLFCLDPAKPLSEIEKIGEDTPEIEIKSENEDLANAVFNGDELMALSNGAPLEITLSAELKQTVLDSEKSAIEEELGANTNVGIYLDINLYKDFAGETSKVSELNKPIKISVNMPENLVNKNDGVKREYSVVRIHNGVAETIPCTHDKDANIIDFSTDRFSTYTVVYTDTEVKAPTGSNSGNEEEKVPEQQPQASDKNEEVKVESPATGDSSSPALWFVLVMISAFGILALQVFKKAR